MTLDASLLLDLARRFPAAEHVREQAEDAAAMAERLRSFMYPKQRTYFTSPAKRRGTRKTRRAGATAGGCRELLARAITIPNFRATYGATTRIEARARAWESDTQSGLVDVLRQYGTLVSGTTVETWSLAGVRVEVREQELALELDNGGRIDLFGADDERAINKMRGRAKHVFWLDEAQDFRFLEKFFKAVVSPALADFDGECWVSGTPGQDCSGMFYEITRDDGALQGWDVHTIAVVDNPYFGAAVCEDGTWFVLDNRKVKHGPYACADDAEHAAIAIRWENTAGQAIRENGWQPDDPDLLREWFAQWVKGDTRHVYPVAATPPGHVLEFAPQRLVDNPFVGTDPRFDGHPRWYAHDAALADLPRRPNGRAFTWSYAIGIDFGYFPDPFALVVWAFTFERPDIYEMFSWKQTKVLPDDQRLYAEKLWDALDNVVVFVGDPGGQKGNLEAWRLRFDIPIDDAQKAAKDTYRELMAGDIRKGLVHYRAGSPLLDEHRHLVYLPTKAGKARQEHADRRLVDGRVPGNHASDAALYAWRFLRHHTFRAPEVDEREAAAKVADSYEEAIDRADQLRAALEQEYGGYGEYE